MSSKAKQSENGSHLHALSPPSSTHMEVSPPSTPSLRSTSSVLPLYTSSPSNASSPMYPSPSRPQPFGEDDAGVEQLAQSQQKSTEFGVSSMSARLGSCVPTPPPSEVANGRGSFEKMSLEQHMQHSDTGREEAMQSFILERFLPAAKVVATDHDHTPYPASKHHPMNPSMASDMSMLRSAKSAARLYSISNTFSPSKNVRWSSPLSQDEGEVESLYDDGPTKSSGFFCVGLKTAISRVHKVVHPSAHSPLRSKSGAALSYGNAASCEGEEDVLPKVNVLSQGMQRRRSFDMRNSYTTFSSSPTFETNPRGRHSSYMAGPRNSLPRNGHVGQDGGPFVSCTSLDETSLHDMSSSCRPISPSIQQLRGSCFKQSSLQGNAWQGSPRLPCDQACPNCHWEQVENSPGGTRSEDFHLQNASRCAADRVSVGIPANRASSIGSSPGGHDALEEALRDPEFAEDDENEFYDALDSLSPIPDNVTPLTCALPASPKSSRKWISDENGAVNGLNHTETPLVFKLSCKTSGGHANHDDSKCFPKKQENPCSPYGGGAPVDSAYIALVKQKHGKTQADQGEDSFSQTMNSLLPLRPSSASPTFNPQCQSGTPNGHKKWMKPGWPLGISGFQSGAENLCFQELEDQDDRFSTNSASVITESNVSSPRVPPSPAGSWLERAMALNASKPSTLATLQRKEKVVSARKKLEFTLSDTRKDVKWEDVVKGSQMHPEHISFSEELRHRHPGNRKAIKPLRL